MPTLAARTTRKRTQNRTARTTGTKRRVTPEDLLRIRTVGDARISPDGGKIAFVSKSVGEKNEVVSDLWWVGTGGADEPRRLTAGGKDSKPRYSPDGATIAFVSAREKTRPQIYTISVEGGYEPVWAPSGSELYYRHEDELVVVSVEETGSSLAEQVFSRAAHSR